MLRRATLAKNTLLMALLVVVTSCVAPPPGRTSTVQRVTDARELVRRLAPDASPADLAALSDTLGRSPPDPRGAAKPFLAQPASADDATRAQECLTAAVYYEARSEPVEGQRAVAQVVLNRVRARAFPHSVCGVVYQGVGSGKACQFSFACDGSTLRARDPAAWARAQRVAIAALNGGVMAEVGAATFYHASYVLPWWASSLARVGAVGSHIFYRWPGAVERALGMRATYAGVEPAAPASGAAGVAIVRGGDFGVTVHRGAAPNVSAETEAAPVTVRPAAFHGVRVHRGMEPPVQAESALDESV
ncbi:cell wall hydrolase [Sphingomonas sp.]|jgi:hypothetical protein|uniref:cell wall hydrolase n=1 Tax=Sphingomonas sp. TaxID=28214 RepID=UPI002D7EC530|nr:cell wall hydrolase [Sphingomonas sp.]HEU0043238.1 cell wall hydrolase [Sphingomonas sp.]